MAGQQKMAMLGARGFEHRTDHLRVDCFTWDRIGRIENLRDYDVVILNLLSFNPEAVDWNAFRRVLNPYVSAEILEPGGVIVVIGDPRIDLPAASAGDSTQSDPQLGAPRFLDWTFFEFYWDGRPGDTVSFSDNSRHQMYEKYLAHLKRWDYSLGTANLDEEVLSKKFDLARVKERGFEFHGETDYFCRNRYNNALAFSVNVFRTKDGYDRRPWGPVIFLPRIALPEAETLNLVLRDLFEIEGPLPEPEWVGKMKAPAQQVLDAEVTELLADLKARVAAVEAKKEELAATRQVLRLLYDQGVSLEAEVRKALRRLGADVEDPSEPGKEDGWISVTVGDRQFDGVLEITGTRSDQFGEDKLRQLLDWIHRGVSLRQKKYKGVFIGSNAIDRPPTERPHGFSPSWTRSAELHEVSALTCADLFSMVEGSAEGRLTDEQVQQFWVTLFESNGLVNLSPVLTTETAPTPA